MLLYQITDGSFVSRDADFVQIRPGNVEMVRKAVAQRAGILVNDRTDIALALGAMGVHLRSHSIAASVLRRIVPQGFVITVACHSAEEVLKAEGADYVLVAPVFKPLSKSDTREPLGPGMLRTICRASPVPVIALGGITAANAPACIEAGAVGVAGITLFQRPAR